MPVGTAGENSKQQQYNIKGGLIPTFYVVTFVNVTTLGVGGIETGISDSVVNAIKETYNNASPYNTFEGKTSTGSEGCWFDFKHSNRGIGMFMSYSFGFCFFRIDVNGNFTIKALGI